MQKSILTNFAAIFQWTAFVPLFIAYTLLICKIFKSNDWTYLCLNLIGGVSFILVGIFAKSWSIWLFNGVWVAITLGAIISKAVTFNKK